MTSPNFQKELSKYFSKKGKKGGQKTAERGPEYYREIQKKSAKVRANKLSPSGN